MAASEHELVSTLTADYLPSGYVASSFITFFNRRKPPFTLSYVPLMESHYRVRMGINMIRGPVLSEAKFFVKCQDEGIKTFIKQNINIFWRTAAFKALSALTWGYSGSEAMYEIRNNLIYFSGLKKIHQFDTRLITIEGTKAGMVVNNVRKKDKVYVGGPKCFWHIQGRDYNPYYGVSRLIGSFSPWLELVTDGGAEDIRRLFHHKYAYTGDTIYYPPGITQLPNGQEVTNKDLAREIVEKRRSGGVTAMPNTTDESGNRRWEILPGQVNPSAANVMEYIETLKREVLEGMGIPPEIIQADGTGSFSGRRVPERAFYSQLQEIVDWLMNDFNSQILKPLLESNFGSNVVDYEIIPISLLKLVQEEDQQGEAQAEGVDTASSSPDEKKDTVKQPRTPVNKPRQVRSSQHGRETKLSKSRNVKQRETRGRAKFAARTKGN